MVVASPMIANSLRQIKSTYSIQYITSVNTEVVDWDDTLLVILASDIWMDVWLAHHLDNPDSPMFLSSIVLKMKRICRRKSPLQVA